MPECQFPIGMLHYDQKRKGKIGFSDLLFGFVFDMAAANSPIVYNPDDTHLLISRTDAMQRAN